MTIDSVVDSLEDLDSAIADLYISGKDEYKDKFILDIKEVSGLQLTNPTKLKKALDSERDANKKAQERVSLFKDIDPTAAKDALEKIKEMDDWDPDKKLEEHKNKFEKQIKDKFNNESTQISKKLNDEISIKEKSIVSLTNQLEKSMVEEASIKVISELGGNSRLLLPHFKEHLQMKANDDGDYSVVVIDKDGDERLTPTAGKNGLMSISELGLEMRDSKDFGSAFQGSDASGSGSGGSNRGGNKSSKKAYRISEDDAKDPDKYRRAKEAAIKANQKLELY